MNTSTDLIRRAQDGDRTAEDLLIRRIRDKHMDRVTYRYRGRNVLVPDSDIESEFLLGCWNAIHKAKLDVGNPLNFILWKGRLKVASLFRSRIKKEVRSRCYDCGNEGRISYRTKVPTCKACGSTDLFTWMKVVDATAMAGDHDMEGAEILDRAASANAEHSFQIATFGLQIEEMRGRLEGRALELFDLIVLEGINRDSSQNYLKEIAQRWGVSTPTVAVVLRRLRESVLEYLDEG